MCSNQASWHCHNVGLFIFIGLRDLSTLASHDMGPIYRKHSFSIVHTHSAVPDMASPNYVYKITHPRVGQVFVQFPGSISSRYLSSRVHFLIIFHGLNEY